MLQAPPVVHSALHTLLTHCPGQLQLVQEAPSAQVACVAAQSVAAVGAVLPPLLTPVHVWKGISLLKALVNWQQEL